MFHTVLWSSLNLKYHYITHMILHNPNATVTHIGHFNTQNTTPGVRIMTDGLILRSCFHIYFTTTTTSKTHDFFKRQKWSLNICTFINHLQTTEYPNRLRDVCRPNRPICFLFSSFWSFKLWQRCSTRFNDENNGGFGGNQHLICSNCVSFTCSAAKHSFKVQILLL